VYIPGWSITFILAQTKVAADTSSFQGNAHANMLNNITDYAIIRVTSSRGTLRYVPSYKEPAGNDDILESMPCRSVSELQHQIITFYILLAMNFVIMNITGDHTSTGNIFPSLVIQYQFIPLVTIA